MTGAVEILAELQRRGVSVRAEGDALKLRPAEKLDTALLERVREAKPEILAALHKRPATCAASCYAVGPGRWIHHQWDGCTTIPKPKAATMSRADCAHCGGTGGCPCPACNLRRTDKPVPCLMCQSEKRQVWLAATRPENEASEWTQ